MMISKLPKWVWLGGALLATNAGIINAVGFLSFQHQGVTHLTGITTQLGASVASRHGLEALHLLGVIFSFLAGATLSGYLIQDSVLKLGRRYGVALLIESALLFVSVHYLKQDQLLGAYLASCACGLQNGMVSTYSGAVLRTTHVSGFITDMGVLLGQMFHRLKIDKRRLFLYGILVFSFFFGSVVGAFLFRYFSYETIYFPAVLTGLTGLIYSIRKYLHLRRSSIL